MENKSIKKELKKTAGKKEPVLCGLEITAKGG